MKYYTQRTRERQCPKLSRRLKRRSIQRLRDLPAGVNAYGRSPECSGQSPQITMILDAAERLLAFEEAHGGPAQRHSGRA